jgi:hypothetical protein
MRGRVVTPDDQKRLAELHREALADWTRRFFRERGMPEPDNAGLRVLIALGREDERGKHQ